MDATNKQFLAHGQVSGEINDLRSALARLAQTPGQLISTKHPVDPNAELAGVYKKIGAGGTVQRPTRTGSAET